MPKEGLISGVGSRTNISIACAVKKSYKTLLLAIGVFGLCYFAAALYLSNKDTVVMETQFHPRNSPGDHPRSDGSKSHCQEHASDSNDYWSVVIVDMRCLVDNLLIC